MGAENSMPEILSEPKNKETDLWLTRSFFLYQDINPELRISVCTNMDRLSVLGYIRNCIFDGDICNYELKKYQTLQEYLSSNKPSDVYLTEILFNLIRKYLDIGLFSLDYGYFREIIITGLDEDGVLDCEFVDIELFVRSLNWEREIVGLRQGLDRFGYSNIFPFVVAKIRDYLKTKDNSVL